MNIHARRFAIIICMFLTMCVPDVTLAQEDRSNHFIIQEDLARKEFNCKDLDSNEAEYIFIADWPNLIISGLYDSKGLHHSKNAIKPIDSLYPSYQFVNNQYLYRVRLGNLKHNKKRTMKFSIKGSKYPFEGQYRVSATRKSRNFIHVGLKSVIRPGEDPVRDTIISGDTVSAVIKIRTKLGLHIELPDTTRIKTDKHIENGDTIHRIIVDTRYIKEDPSAALIVTTLDGQSNKLRFELKNIETPRKLRTYRVEPVDLPPINEPKANFIKFQIEPADAYYILYLDGTQLDVDELVKYVYMGRHDIRVEAPNYHTIDTFFVMDSEKDTTMSLTLHPHFGALSITNRQSKKATITLDGMVVGTVPTTTPICGINSGTHFLKIAKRGYNPFIQTIEITDGDTLTIIPKLAKSVPPSPTARQVTISVTTPGTHSFVVFSTSENDTLMVETDKHGKGEILLEPGNYKYQIFVPKYHTETGELVVTNDVPTHLDAKLRPHFGQVVINNKQLRNAVVTLDGKDVDKVPCTLKQVPSGTHYLQITPKDENSIPLRKRVEVADDSTTYITNIEKIQKYVFLKFIAEDSVKITINKSFVGYTETLMLSYDHSPVEILCQKDGYTDTTILYYFKLGDNDSVVRLPNLSMETGLLAVSSKPNGAGIYIDSKLVGSTPAQGLKAPVGRHTITIKKLNFQGVDTIVNIRKNEPTTLTDIKLQKERKRLSGKTLIMGGLIPYSTTGKWLSTNESMPVIGFTIGHVRWIGLYASAYSNFNFDNPSRAINLQGYTDNGTLVQLNPDNYPQSITYFTGTVGLNIRVCKPLWLFAGAGYGIKKTVVSDIHNALYYVRPHSAQGYCGEAGLGLTFSCFAITASINILDMKNYFNGQQSSASLTYRLGAGFAF